MARKLVYMELRNMLHFLDNEAQLKFLSVLTKCIEMLPVDKNVEKGDQRGSIPIQ